MDLFVYGELCKPTVLLAVIGRVPSAEPALLPGYRRILDRDSGYFRAEPRDHGVVAGLLLAALDDVEMATLDEFENVGGGEYHRVEVEVKTLTEGPRRSAWAYVTPWERAHP
ncbi:MAG: gamma-glutamylcyclotransferase [Acidobacteriota bacterium]